jgi:hypothetical protein
VRPARFTHGDDLQAFRLCVTAGRGPEFQARKVQSPLHLRTGSGLLHTHLQQLAARRPDQVLPWLELSLLPARREQRIYA